MLAEFLAVLGHTPIIHHATKVRRVCLDDAPKEEMARSCRTKEAQANRLELLDYLTRNKSARMIDLVNMTKHMRRDAVYSAVKLLTALGFTRCVHEADRSVTVHRTDKKYMGEELIHKLPKDRQRHSMAELRVLVLKMVEDHDGPIPLVNITRTFNGSNRRTITLILEELAKAGKVHRVRLKSNQTVVHKGPKDASQSTV